MKKRLGIFGGTFDPIHIGHLIIAEAARQECDLEKVLFIPVNSPPHKNDRIVSSPDHRFEMTRLAVEDNSCFEALNIELKRGGISYTIDTLTALDGIYSGDYEFWLILGGDSLLAIETWKEHEKVIDMCNLAVSARPGYSYDKCKVKSEELRNTWETKIQFIDSPLIDISSTDIRHRIAKGRPVRYMVPDKVWEYLIVNSVFLYNSSAPTGIKGSCQG
ncbi:MAG: nicotinate-nucleotide adenylyltransferase [Clostridiales bacterium]|nr:nicotinate-nucleotide adenylyltransferase [Clostridiales bacterium]